MKNLNTLRAFARGEIDESAFSDIQGSEEPFELDDPEFLEECVTIAAPIYIQCELISESAEEINAAVNETYTRLKNYMVGQGLISEATIAVDKNTNVMHFSKQAQINRLEKIITLKLARKDNAKEYKKFKIGAQIKKKNMLAMVKRYGNKAKAYAKKAWMKLQRNPKVTTTIAEKKKRK